MIWRLVLEKIATLQEIENHWTLTDLLDAHDALNYRDYIMRKAEDKAKQEANNSRRK